MLLIEEQRARLHILNDKMPVLTQALEQDKLQMKLDELEIKTAQPDFWDDAASSGAVLKEMGGIKETLQSLTDLQNKIEDAYTLIELAIEAEDESMCEEITAEIDAIEKIMEEKRLQTLFSGEFDKLDVTVTFHPGAGGTESQDWAQMLYRMYSRFAAKLGFDVKLLEYQDGDEAGLKSASIEISGTNAYGYFKGENGVHRLVRISPFDSSGRRHTSFASIEVVPMIENDTEVEINPADLKVDTYRASGAGGQHVNKTSSAVRLIHKPSGIVVACQEERSQLQNREKCMRMLASKLYEIEQEKLSSEVTGMRRSQVGTGMRNERIRTYNFPQGRVTDHRVGLTLYKIDAVMDGDLDEIINALATADQAEKLKNAQ